MTGAAVARRLLVDVEDTFERIFAALQPMAQAYRDLVAARREQVVREDLAALRPRIYAVLAEHRQLVAGAGIIAAPGVLADSRYWLEWWWTRTSGAPEALRVNLDPSAPDFFDYTTTEWYDTPERTTARYVAGPHVDYACTNEYAVTIVQPVLLDGRLLGIAAADVPVARLEEQVLPGLSALARPMALVNAAGRVVVSSSPRLAPGLLVPLGRDEEIGPADTADARGRPPAASWHLVPAS